MLYAIEHVRPMRGGAQAHLIRGSDHHHYVVKFMNNPQHARILANEWLATHIARDLMLSAPPCRIIDITRDFIERSPGLVIRAGGRAVPVCEGPAFASRVPAYSPLAPVYDYMPEPGLDHVENLAEFAGILLADKWLCNCDGRQVIYCRPRKASALRVFFIDFGFCFNAGDWTFPDSPLRGVYCRNLVYKAVKDWDSFEPFISRIEEYPLAALRLFLSRMPSEWRPDEASCERLFEILLQRRAKVRALVHAVQQTTRAPFEHWPYPARELSFPTHSAVPQPVP